MQKSEIAPSEFCPISGDRDDVGIPNLARTFLNAPKIPRLQVLSFLSY